MRSLLCSAIPALSFVAAMVGNACCAAQEPVKVGDTFRGAWTQKSDPASVWEVDFTVLETTGKGVKVKIQFHRQKLDADGRIIAWGLVHVSEGGLAAGEMNLECKNVNLPQFQHNLGWKFAVVVRDDRLIGSGFDLKRVSGKK